MEYLFVYGTLLTTSGHPLHNYVRGFSDFMGAASVGGIRVDVDDLPGLVLSGDPDSRVVGELYEIHEGASETLFEVVDRFVGCSEDDSDEDFPDFFRHRLEVKLLEDQKNYFAWVYLCNE